MNRKLVTALFLGTMVASSALFAMDFKEKEAAAASSVSVKAIDSKEEEAPSSVSVKKSESVKAWKGDKKISVGKRKYTLKGSIEGTCGITFLSMGESDESQVSFGSPYSKGPLHFMYQESWMEEIKDENPESPTFGQVIRYEPRGIDGIVNIELTPAE